MADRTKLTDKDFTIHELGESFNHTFAYLKIYADGSHNLTEIRELQTQILDDIKKVPKLELKLKMMEISFEQINNSRNDLIKELADCEMLNNELKDKLKLEQLINEAINDESFNFKEKLEKIDKELQKRIDEEIKHINHPKQIYRTVEHNCKYNLRICEILKEILNVGK